MLACGDVYIALAQVQLRGADRSQSRGEARSCLLRNLQDFELQSLMTAVAWESKTSDWCGLRSAVWNHDKRRRNCARGTREISKGGWHVRQTQGSALISEPTKMTGKTFDVYRSNRLKPKNETLSAGFNYKRDCCRACTPTLMGIFAAVLNQSPIRRRRCKQNAFPPGFPKRSHIFPSPVAVCHSQCRGKHHNVVTHETFVNSATAILETLCHPSCLVDSAGVAVAEIAMSCCSEVS